MSTDFHSPHLGERARVGSERKRVGSQRAVYVEADSEVRRMLKDRQTSNLKKYMWLTVGEGSVFRLLWIELLTMMLGGMRGALGIYLRQKCYRHLFKRCGRGVVIGCDVTIRHPQRIELGDGVVIDDHVVLDGKGEGERTTIELGNNTIVGRNSMLVCKGGHIQVAEDVNISVNCTVISESVVTVGAKTLIAGHCYIIAGGNHGTELNGTPFVDQQRMQRGGVTILENCWLGAHATVLDGTRVGPDTVVGAAALVNRDAPARSIVGGVPAAVISQRSSRDLQLRRVAH